MMIQEIFQAFLLIFIAEMGDKTQILAMAFATRFPVKKVLFGIFLGALFNHGLAVALGSYISNFVPIATIQIIAGFAFVGFSLWTLKSEDEDDESEEQKNKFGPVLTVALAFFIGELGDKTQLTAITLGTDAVYPLAIVLGTVSGMIVTGGMGILIGKKLGDKVPEFAIKIIAASVFMFFGISKLYQSLPNQYLIRQNIIVFLGIISVLVIILLRKQLLRRKQGFHSVYLARSKELYDYYHHMQGDIERICLGLDTCVNCQGEHCIVGYTKEIVNNQIIDNNNSQQKTFKLRNNALDKAYNREDIIDSLVDTLIILEKRPSKNALKPLHDIRKQLELLLIKESIESMKNLEIYRSELERIDLDVAKQVFEKLNFLSGKDKHKEHKEIINLGNRISNIYLIPLSKGYLLIDTGYGEQYESFVRKLSEHQIEISDISYILLTHAHDDHAGFLNQILEKSNAKVIMHENAQERLVRGQNSFDGGCTSRLALIVCKIMKLLGKGEHRFEPVNQVDRYIILDEKTQLEVEEKITSKIIMLPGHTSDSIGLLLEDGSLFCGDAAMNGFPSQNNVIIWIEDLKAYLASWNLIINADVTRIYPSHGKPFDKKKLIKNKNKLNRIKLYPLH